MDAQRHGYFPTCRNRLLLFTWGDWDPSRRGLTPAVRGSRISWAFLGRVRDRG